jgi:hypothetical protein
MKRTEAFILAANWASDLQSQAADALYNKCVELGYQIAIDNLTADWVILDKNDAEIARCK